MSQSPADRPRVEVGIRLLDHARIIVSLLTRTEKWRLLTIFVSSLLSIFLDILSLGLVIPIVAFLSGASAGTIDGLRSRIPMIDDLSELQLVAIVMTLLTAVYVVKNLFLLFTAHLQNRFNADVSSRLAHRLMELYMSQPYEWMSRRNSAELVRNLNNASIAISGGVKPFMFLISDTLVGVGILGVLLVVEPVGGLAALGIFGLAGWGFQRAMRQRLREFGAEKQALERAVVRDVLESVGALKDLKIAGRERYFIDRHERDRIRYADVQRRYLTIQAIPRLWLETLAVLCLSALIVLLVASGRALSDSLPMVALFAAAGFRILPSINRMIASVQDLHFSRPIVSTLAEEFRLPPGALHEMPSSRIPFETFSMEELGFGYADSREPALRNASLRFSAGEAIGIVGPSGSGKSTLVDLILGLLHPARGSILINGQPMDTVLFEWQQSIGYVPQDIFLADDSIRRNVAIGVDDEQIDDEAVWRALRSAQLAEFVEFLPEGLDSMVGERGSRLSGGQRQRIGIARALYHDPDVLVLDEATSSLDLETESGVMQAVESLHGVKTTVIVSHRLSTVEYCNRTYLVNDGHVRVDGEAITEDGSGGTRAMAPGV